MTNMTFSKPTNMNLHYTHKHEARSVTQPPMYLKTLSKSGINKPISPLFEEAHIVTDGQTDRQTDKFFDTIH